jgi:hypothetical protein
MHHYCLREFKRVVMMLWLKDNETKNVCLSFEPYFLCLTTKSLKETQATPFSRDK